MICFNFLFTINTFRVKLNYFSLKNTYNTFKFKAT